MSKLIDWHKKNIEWWKKKLNVSNYGIAWIAFIKGLIIGLLIYHFFIYTETHAQVLKIIDGDTIVINGEKIRFSGIDTPELKQTCMKGDEKIFCGMLAKKILIKKKPSGLTLHSSDRKLVQTIKRLCQNLQINFICCTGKKTRRSFSILGLNKSRIT